MYIRQFHGFKMYVLEKRFRILIRNDLFPPLPNMESHNPSPQAECHGHARPTRVAHGRMPMTSQTLYVFSYLVFYFCIYDVSKISCLGLLDMKCLKMYYREISPYPRLYCEPLLFLSCLLI